MTEGIRGARDRERRRDDAMSVHLNRIYVRIDDLDARMKKIERIVWVLGSVAVVTAGTAVLNLATNLAQVGVTP